MENSVFYFNSQAFSGNFNIAKLSIEISGSSIVTNLINILSLDEKIVCIFEEEISEDDRNTLDNIVAAHSHIEITDYTQAIIRNAIAFAQEQIIVFAAENIAMGITSAGKTKLVADYLSDITRYAQTGSLYEIVNEIDKLISDGIPSNLSPFVTETRLNNFKIKIFQYLGVS